MSDMQPHDGAAVRGSRHRNPLRFRRWRGDLKTIADSGVFDTEWYLSQNPDVARLARKKKIDPLAHYVRRGAFEGRNPNPAFDSAWYVAQNPDAAGTNPLLHYLRYGRKNGSQPHPAFDEKLYYDSNPNLILPLKAGLFTSAFQHFVQQGRRDIARRDRWRRLLFRVGKQMFDFDEAAYVEDNPDVCAMIERGAYASGINHFLAIGYAEIAVGIRAPYSSARTVRLLKRIPGSAAPGRQDACIFAHYDSHGIVDEYVIEYLKTLAGQDIDIYFVTATDDRAQLAKVRPYAVELLIKNDAGRDFGSWYIALKELGFSQFDKYSYLMFANDSVYFPVAPAEIVFSRMARKRCNIWGIADSQEHGIYHIQSFFLAFDSAARSELLPYFMRRYEMRPYLTKYGQIVEFEFGLSQRAVNVGLSASAYCCVQGIREEALRDPELLPWRELLRPGLEAINPTHDVWDLLIQRYQCPVVKTELLRDNPKKVRNVEAWRHIIGDGVSADTIRAHLDRTKQRVAPLSLSKNEDGKELALKEEINGQGTADSKRLVLFSHYDPDGEVDEHVIAQVAALQRCDCSVVFITSASQVRELEKILPHAAYVLVKNDAGRDFGSWYLGATVFAENLKRYQSVIWMNDSTYFPLYDPAEMFRIMDSRKLDLWGIIDSYLDKWHIMSWFWSFGRKIIEDGWFDYYCSEYNDAYSKWDQIHNYEMRFPESFRQQGYRVGSYISVDACREYARSLSDGRRKNYSLRKDVTATHDYWDLMITRFRCPALKVELLLHNPLKKDLKEVFSIIRSHSDYDVKLIQKHLRRLKAKLDGKACSPWSAEKLRRILSLESSAFVNAAYRNVLNRAPQRKELLNFLARPCSAESKLSALRELIVAPEALMVEECWAELVPLLQSPLNDVAFASGVTNRRKFLNIYDSDSRIV